MTVREINRLASTGKPVVARYVLAGVLQQGRIIRARVKYGLMQCKTISGDWAALEEAWEAK